VVIKYEGKEYFISKEMWDAMTADANKRNMTIDEYVAEAFTLYKEQKNARH